MAESEVDVSLLYEALSRTMNRSSNDDAISRSNVVWCYTWNNNINLKQQKIKQHFFSSFQDFCQEFCYSFIFQLLIKKYKVIFYYCLRLKRPRVTCLTTQNSNRGILLSVLPIDQGHKERNCQFDLLYSLNCPMLNPERQ